MFRAKPKNTHMDKINLLYVITKLELGGAQKQLLSIIDSLDKRRFNVFLFSAKCGLMVGDAVSIEGLALVRSRWLDRPLNPFKDPLAMFEIYRFIKKNNIQIVHTHSSKAGILGRIGARLAGVRFICHTVHGWSFNDFQPYLLRKVFIGLERFVSRFTDRIIVVSLYDKQKGLDNRIGSLNKYRLIRYGIEPAGIDLREPKIKRELGIDSNALVVGMVSCLKPQKAPQDFIRLAFLVNKSLKSTKFILIGDGKMRQPLQRLIDKLGLQRKVILTGWRRDVFAILPGIDVFVLTSLWEGLPVSVLEAVSSSVPVVATNTGGVAEVIIDAKTGFLVRPHSIQAMSEKVVILLKDANLRKQLAKSALDSLNGSFALGNMVKSNQDLYETLVSGSN